MSVWWPRHGRQKPCLVPLKWRLQAKYSACAWQATQPHRNHECHEPERRVVMKQQVLYKVYIKLGPNPCVVLCWIPFCCLGSTMVSCFTYMKQGKIHHSPRLPVPHRNAGFCTFPLGDHPHMPTMAYRLRLVVYPLWVFTSQITGFWCIPGSERLISSILRCFQPLVIRQLENSPPQPTSWSVGLTGP